MKVALVEIPLDPWNLTSRMYLPNPGTLAVGTYLRQNGHTVRMIDCHAEGVSWGRLAGLIKDYGPDLVGTSSYTPDIYGRILLARLVKKISPSIVTVCGGSHISLAPEETLRVARDIDYAVIGEGEQTFLELVRMLESGGAGAAAIPGLAYISPEGKFVRTVDREPLDDYDDLPLPDYSMLPMGRYKNTYFPGSPSRGFSCSFSRGCTEQCTFCSSNRLWRYRWRGRSAAHIVEELAVLNRVYGKRSFLFTDNNFLFDRKRNLEFIERMKLSGLRIEFRPLARVDTLLRDKDLLPDLRQIGLTAIQIGVESYDQASLNCLRKNYQAEQIRELSACLKDADVPYTRVFLIVGNREDCRESGLRLLRKTKEYGFGAIQISCLVPWPGTDFFSQAKAQGLVRVWDYRLYDWENGIMPTRTLTHRKVTSLKAFLFYRWHLDPSVLLRNLSNRYLRHYHLYTLASAVLSALRYKLVHALKIWRLFSSCRLIQEISCEHLDYVRKQGR